MSNLRIRDLLITAALVMALAPLALAQGQAMSAQGAHRCPGMEGGAGHGMNADAEHRYDPATVTTVTGTVEEVVLRAGRGGATGLHLQVVVGDDERVEVLVGPTFYVFPQGLEIDAGDRVTATGSRFTADGTAMLMAREITEGQLTVQLRDEAGMPMWQGQGPRSDSVDAEGQGKGPGHGCDPCRGRMSEGSGTGGGMCKMHGGDSGSGHRHRSGR